MQRPPIRIGARASKLALVQARWTQAAICAALGEPSERKAAVAPLVEITNSGDRIQDRRLLEVGGKALFTKEIEEVLLDGRIDCAVRSLKDVPAERPIAPGEGCIVIRTPAADVKAPGVKALNHALGPQLGQAVRAAGGDKLER